MASMILDGSGFVFRAYYWLPELHDADGHNINAIFGFFRMFLKLLDQKPKQFVIARDSPVKTIKKEQFITYKANRISMPDEFKRQMTRIKEIIEELWVPALQAAGYEADDIIGHLVNNSLGKIEEIRIVSADKDIKQLLQPWVKIYDPTKDITIDHDWFFLEYGFTPAQFVDYMSLVGDSADNIPGVSGIWPKIARDLIHRFASLEGIYAHLDEISESVATKLRVWQLQWQESKQLITMVSVPDIEGKTFVDFSWTPDFKRFDALLVEELHMHSLESLISALKKSRQSGEPLSLFG